MRIIVRPLELSKNETMRAALQLLQKSGIVVRSSWFVDADVVLLVGAQEVQKAVATLAEDGFNAMVHNGEQQPASAR